MSTARIRSSWTNWVLQLQQRRDKGEGGPHTSSKPSKRIQQRRRALTSPDFDCVCTAACPPERRESMQSKANCASPLKVASWASARFHFAGAASSSPPLSFISNSC